MSTFANVASDLAAAAEALGARTRMGSDHRNDLESIAVGATKYQIRTAAAGKDLTFNSSTGYDKAVMSLETHHRLASASNERAYTEGQLLTDLASVMREKWWRDLASAFEVVEAPEVSIERIGNVVSYTVSATVLVAP